MSSVAAGGAGSPHHQQARTFFDQHLARTVHLTPAQQQEYRQAAHAIFDQMTPQAMERFNRNVNGYRFFADLDQLSAHAVPGYAVLPASVKPYAAVSGAYNRLTKELELDGGGRLAGKVFPAQDHYAHEFGHAVDGPQWEISGRREWHDAWDVEIRPNPPNPNAATNPQEGFAAFAALAYGTAANRAGLEQTLPLCVAVWRAQNLW